MLKFLLKRPIAVSMSYAALIIFSIAAFFQLPIALLPDIDVPQIIIQINAPNQSPAEIEQNILRPIRENLLTLSGLKDVQSIASSETGRVSLDFEYGTSMNLAYIEVNEKIDGLSYVFPKNLERPKIVRLNTSDIPLIRLQIIPKNEADILQISNLAEKILKKRLETLDGVSLVDLNGLQKKMIGLRIDHAKMNALQISETDLIRAIRENNQDLGGISVLDGQYRYFIKLQAGTQEIRDLENLSIRQKSGKLISLKQIARLEETTQTRQGFHLFDSKEGIVINIHQQSQAKVTQLMPLIYQTSESFKKEYPQVDFYFSQDQSLLLREGIASLQTSLMWGGLFAFAVLFLFMGNLRVCLVMGLCLPVSLIISFLFFYFFQISLNIISLSGLTLGLGMTIDNAIVVLDNISMPKHENQNFLENVALGTLEVIPPLIGSVLTTVAVFIPLVFLSGLSGALFYDQAISVTIILVISLGVSFSLIPLLYLLFFKGKSNVIVSDTRVFQGILRIYKASFQKVFQYKFLSFITLLGFSSLGYFGFSFLKKEGLPTIEKNETQLIIQWNEPISPLENKRRSLSLLSTIQKDIVLSECDLGISDFILQNEENSLQKALIYLLIGNVAKKETVEKKITLYIQKNFPKAIFSYLPAPNAFDQLFRQNQAYFEVKLKSFQHKQWIPPTLLNETLKDISTQFPQYKILSSPGSLEETVVKIQIDRLRLALYQVSYEDFLDRFRSLFGALEISELKSLDESTPIRMIVKDQDLFQKLKNSRITNTEGKSYPMLDLMTFDFDSDYKNITADRLGIYHGMSFQPIDDFEKITQKLNAIALKKQLLIDFSGQYFSDRNNLAQLIRILILSVVLLYFILSAQFESFVQPLIVIATLSLGIAGALLFLKLGGASLNVMSAIGLVAMLGIMVNDAILKIDTINQLRKNHDLETAIHTAGMMRLKPILMTSLTTILAILPILFSSGIGADLQKPLVLAVMGGLSLGTITALYFVPLFYYYVAFFDFRPKSSTRTSII